jgi:lipooligosaccharide transport system permease protein
LTAATHPSALRVTEYFARSYRRTWRASIFSTFVTPILYLAAMGVGLGSFVDHGGHSLSSLGGVSYLDFVAPALVATTAMQTAATESTYPVMGSIKWNRTYYAMLATPLRVRDVLEGHLLWIATRITVAVAVYVAAIAAFGVTTSPEAVLVVPAGVLTGLAFATPLAAFSALQTNDGAFSLVFRLGLIPLFLFSGTFFPISQLPTGLQVIAVILPLWHGVSLCRGLALSDITALAALGHIVYLLALAAVGAAVASRTYRRRLVI